MPQTWQQITGTTYGNPELSSKNRVVAAKETRLDELVEPADDFNTGLKSGDKVAVAITSRISTTGETPLSETVRVPLAQPVRNTYQAVVYERGLAIQWTGSFEDLDRLDVEETNIAVLRDHMARTHNKVINDALISGRSFTYVALTASTRALLTDGTVAGTAAAPFSLFHAQGIAEDMTTLNVPTADGQNYWMGISPKAYFQVLKDDGFVEVKRYAASGAEGILNNEVGTIGQLRLILDNDALANSIGSGSAYGSGIVVGAEGCKEVLGPYPPHFRVNTNYGGDFGRSSAIAWLSFQGYAVPFNYTAHGDGRVLHYTSA